ncbi:MAG: F0F1 ATP synthase subunit epsilon [Anaerolineales bacterium]|nr:MAG: F0F1 ATP synthase subunit epsilon [Anaerolineales bacterium]
MPLKLDIVTVERLVYSEDVDMVIAPGIEGQLGILPRHAPLLTALTYGELRVKRGGEEESFAIGGGFMEVQPDRVTVLADTAERAEEIDLERAQAARRRAEEHLERQLQNKVDFARSEAALRRSLIRIKLGEARRRRGGRRTETPKPGVRTPSE